MDEPVKSEYDDKCTIITVDDPVILDTVLLSTNKDHQLPILTEELLPKQTVQALLLQLITTRRY